MDDKAELEFNSISFEKKLTNLKDSQESINSCCQWCLQNRQYHKKIVSSWLNVLKRVKIEQRLILFYLANDVIQYAKRRNYEFVESWGTTLQKATTMVREEKVKHKILRIFKIWEQRGVYGEEFIADLCGLISASPPGKKGDETHEFQSSYLIQKIKLCTQLEVDTDLKLRELKEHNPKIQIDGDALIASLKDRAHVDDVEKELDDYHKFMDDYINALKSEIKARIHLISLLSQAENALDNDKKDVKTVTTAYKAFATKVKALKKKLDEKIPLLNSPLPSPDIDAPSPSPDSDIELPSDNNTPPSNTSGSADVFTDAGALYTNPGYYNPVPPPAPINNTNANYNNHFSTFIGSDLSFNLQNIRNSFQNEQKDQKSSANGSSQAQTTEAYNITEALSSLFPSMAFPPPPPAISSPTPDISNLQYNSSGHIPLQPPPMPPFNKTTDMYNSIRFPETFNGSNVPSSPYSSNTNYQAPPLPTSVPYTSSNSSRNFQPPLPNSFTSNDEYNPEEELETWAPEPTWDTLPPVEMDTPESPPMFEKAGYGDPIEYREGAGMGNVADVDHRILPGAKILSRHADIDHRNLISLTSSPSIQDRDYRTLSNPTAPVLSTSTIDQDYRTSFNMENFKLPPPPPPPPKLIPSDMMNEINAFNTYSSQLQLSNQFSSYLSAQSANLNAAPGVLPKPFGVAEENDMNDSMNMSLSESESETYIHEESNKDLDIRNTQTLNHSSTKNSYELPPPFSNLLDDVDANQFLDNVTEDLEQFDTNDLSGFDQLSMPLINSHNAIIETSPLFPPNYLNLPNPNMASPEMLSMSWMSLPPENYTNNQFDFQSFHHHGGILLGAVNNREIHRGHGNWVNRNDFRGHGRRGLRGGPNFRGNRGGERGGNWNNRGRGGRGRESRGNFRGGF